MKTRVNKTAENIGLVVVLGGLELKISQMGRALVDLGVVVVIGAAVVVVVGTLMAAVLHKSVVQHVTTLVLVAVTVFAGTQFV